MQRGLLPQLLFESQPHKTRLRPTRYVLVQLALTPCVLDVLAGPVQRLIELTFRSYQCWAIERWTQRRMVAANRTAMLAAVYVLGADVT
jgi:hypothetical protein